MEEKYKRLYESLVEANKALEAELCRALQKISQLEFERGQLQAAAVSQQSIVQKMLTDKNKEHNEILEENQRLQNELSKFKVS